jgi:CheY-like chemotaxis protein
LVIVDAWMPGMDGFALVREIQQQPELARSTVVMLSSSDRPDHQSQGRDLGIHAYLLKPVKASELLDCIVNLLHRPESATPSGRPEPRAEETSSAVPPLSLRILLAEDNPVNQLLATRLLDKFGHKVQVANNGKEALALLEKHGFDVVLMDVQMPEMDGFETTARIRTREQATGQHLPIVALTAHAMKGDRERCLQAGMDGYVTKPIQTQELLDTLEALVRRREPPPPIVPQPKTRQAPFDRTAVLARVGGDRSLLAEVVDLFLQESSGMVDELRAALDIRESKRLMRAAHTIKGAVDIFGAQAVYDAAFQVETLAQQGKLDQARDAIAVLEKQIETLRSALAQLVTDRG